MSEKEPAALSDRTVLDVLDRKSLEYFPGRVVRKDLVSALKGQLNVPAYVVEYLLGKYCSSEDEEVIEAGLQEVRQILTENYVRPDQMEWFKSQVRERGLHRVIDKVKVRLVETEDKYWASLVNLQIDRVHISEDLIQRYERLLGGGIWAVTDLAYDPQLVHRGDVRPFTIAELCPVQLAAGNLVEEVRARRPSFSRGEWLDFLLRSVGMEPTRMSHRLKMLYPTPPPSGGWRHLVGTPRDLLPSDRLGLGGQAGEVRGGASVDQR